MNFDFKAATPVTSGITSSYFLFGAASQVAATPEIYTVGAAVGSSTATFTNKTFDTAGTGNSFSINGVAATANTGTGAVARATSPTFVTPTLGVAAATNLAIATGTITASDPFTLTQTWNSGGTTFTAFDINVTNTASAAASMLQNWRVGGTSVGNISVSGAVTHQNSANSTTAWRVLSQAASVVAGVDTTNRFFYAGGASGGCAFAVSTSTGLATTYDGGGFAFTTGASADSAAVDVVLRRDAANTLAQRNDTNAQDNRIYYTYTNASNYARLAIGYSGTNPRIFTQVAGTGSGDDLLIGTTTSHALAFYTNNTQRWQINGNGHLLTPADNTYDIGASGATRPRNVYVAGTGTFGSTLSTAASFQGTGASSAFVAPNGGSFYWSTRSFIASPADGVVTISKNNGSSAAAVQLFGMTVAALPAAATYPYSVAFVTDATATTPRSTVAGGGANKVMVMSDGTNWLIVA